MAVILFDGVCNLCNGLVRFVIARDPKAHFKFAALTSEAGRQVLQSTPVSGVLPDSMVLIEDGQVFVRADAALRVLRRLRFPWSLAYALVIVPWPIRDRVYDLVARNRYRWFGRRETCMMPASDVRGRFLGNS
jgi:predicted DCC family thiol-disulfide oxidoreductase YuxK